MFKLKEKSFTGFFSLKGFQIYLKNSCCSTKNKDIIKALKADDRFIEEKPIAGAKAKSDSDDNSTEQPAN
jgi:hypothetical protein